MQAGGFTGYFAGGGIPDFQTKNRSGLNRGNSLLFGNFGKGEGYGGVQASGDLSVLEQIHMFWLSRQGGRTLGTEKLLGNNRNATVFFPGTITYPVRDKVTTIYDGGNKSLHWSTVPETFRRSKPMVADHIPTHVSLGHVTPNDINSNNAGRRSDHVVYKWGGGDIQKKLEQAFIGKKGKFVLLVGLFRQNFADYGVAVNSSSGKRVRWHTRQPSRSISAEERPVISEINAKSHPSLFILRAISILRSSLPLIMGFLNIGGVIMQEPLMCLVQGTKPFVPIELLIFPVCLLNDRLIF